MSRSYSAWHAEIVKAICDADVEIDYLLHGNSLKRRVHSAVSRVVVVELSVFLPKDRDEQQAWLSRDVCVFGVRADLRRPALIGRGHFEWVKAEM